MATLPADGQPGRGERLLLTPEEAADMLNISRSKLYELLQGDTLKSVKIGKARRIPTKALHAYVDTLTGEQTHT